MNSQILNNNDNEWILFISNVTAMLNMHVTSFFKVGGGRIVKKFLTNKKKRDKFENYKNPNLWRWVKTNYISRFSLQNFTCSQKCGWIGGTSMIINFLYVNLRRKMFPARKVGRARPSWSTPDATCLLKQLYFGKVHKTWEIYLGSW